MSNDTTLMPGDHYLLGLSGFLFRLIVRRWLLIIGLPALAMVIAYIATGFLKPVYPGQANLQIGRIAGTEIQNRNTVVDRINSLPFKAHVLQVLHPAPDQGSSFEPEASDGLSAQTNQFSDWVTINSRANTPEQSSKLIGSAVSVIQGEHEKIASPAVESLRSQLNLANADIASLSKLKQELTDRLSSEPEKKIDESNIPPLLDSRQRSTLLRDRLLYTEQAMTEATTRQIKLTEQLSPAQTFSTHLLDDIFVGHRPTSPRRAALAAAAGAVAFFLCLLYALFSLPKVPRRS